MPCTLDPERSLRATGGSLLLEGLGDASTRRLRSGHRKLGPWTLSAVYGRQAVPELVVLDPEQVCGRQAVPERSLRAGTRAGQEPRSLRVGMTALLCATFSLWPK